MDVKIKLCQTCFTEPSYPMLDYLSWLPNFTNQHFNFTYQHFLSINYRVFLPWVPVELAPNAPSSILLFPFLVLVFKLLLLFGMLLWFSLLLWRLLLLVLVVEWLPFVSELPTACVVKTAVPDFNEFTLLWASVGKLNLGD